jgi:ADP-ribosyl-[dinitrogen reductase] hydrolase
MSSTHQRNTRGMQDAPRCEALARASKSCRSPAVAGRKRCHVHGGKGSEGKNHGQEYRDYTKAYLHWDQLLNPAIKKVDKLARKVERTGEAIAILEELHAVSRMLKDITRQKQSELAANYVVPEAQQLAEQEQAASLDLARQYSAKGHRSRERTRDRARGAILGLATGEAVGVTLMGRNRDSYQAIEDMQGGGELRLGAGQWAGDTAMALALMESLNYLRRFDERDFMERLLEWRDDGVHSCTGRCVGIGETTRDALVRYQQFDNPVAGETHADDLSNGSVARIAPVAVLYWKRETERSNVAARQSMVTHGGPYAVLACVGFADILADAIAGKPREAVLRRRGVQMPNSDLVVTVGTRAGLQRSEVSGANNALTSLEAAMWCVGTTETFKEAVLAAANLGGDAGSTAALAGQLAGALYGACAIPGHWLEQLAWREKIAEMTDELFRRSGSRAA